MTSAPSSSSSHPQRRRPHCHTCGNPMVGHRRQDGFPICPTEPYNILKNNPSASPSLASTPPTPPPSHPGTNGLTPRSLLPPQSHPSLTNFTPPFEFGSRPWRRENPNWEEPEPALPPPQNKFLHAVFVGPAGPAGFAREQTPGAASMVSTVLVDDDGHPLSHEHEVNPKREEVDDDFCEDRCDVETNASFSASWLVDRVARTDPRVVRVIGTRRGDEGAALGIQEAAGLRGIHTGMLHVPSAGGIKREHSWWMVLGRDGDVVNKIVDGQQAPQELMPGIVRDLKMEGPRMASFLQLILAGFIGGVVAIYGLSCL